MSLEKQRTETERLSILPRKHQHFRNKWRQRDNGKGQGGKIQEEGHKPKETVWERISRSGSIVKFYREAKKK